MELRKASSELFRKILLFWTDCQRTNQARCRDRVESFARGCPGPHFVRSSRHLQRTRKCRSRRNSQSFLVLRRWRGYFEGQPPAFRLGSRHKCKRQAPPRGKAGALQQCHSGNVLRKGEQGAHLQTFGKNSELRDHSAVTW